MVTVILLYIDTNQNYCIVMTAQKFKKSGKITQLTFSPKMTFLIHESATGSYGLFCNIYTKLNLDNITDFSNKIVNVIKSGNIYYFFDDYEYFINLQDGDVIYARLADGHEVDIKQAGWNAVFDFIKTIHPVRPDIIRAFIEALPDDVAIKGLEYAKGKLTIADVLRYVKIPRYNFDYQDRKTPALPHYLGMPMFDDLIAEVINECQ